MCLIAPYPYNPNKAEDFRLDSDFDMSGKGLLWYGRTQLFSSFRCTLCPVGAQPWEVQRQKEVSLVFFSAMEPIDLTPDSVLQEQNVPMLYDTASSSAIPTLYICDVKNVLGRVPLMPCFLEGSCHHTIPHSFGGHDLQGAKADTRQGSGNGSKLYEVNLWLWRYGRGQPRKMSVAEALSRRQEHWADARRKGTDTRRRRKAARRQNNPPGSTGTLSRWCPN